MNPTTNVTLRFAFVALSTLFGAIGFALVAMLLVHSAYISANGSPTELDSALFILLMLSCACAAPLGGSLAFLAAVFALYLQNMRTERARQAA
ncbi:MAG: hypothetical protein KatS3mg053_0964 [Candidatus Roseilinea sp.]|jgi:uncharacterized membrane protein|nr:MAG: hypothetical protein KatS3mg053_0964 [Candidatus Roseilinea sp.]